MSLVVALANRDSIVIAVDSREVVGDNEMPPCLVYDTTPKYIRWSSRCVVVTVIISMTYSCADCDTGCY